MAKKKSNNKKNRKRYKDKTMIPVKIKTRERLKTYKVIPRESFDGVINRSLDNTDKLEKRRK